MSELNLNDDNFIDDSEESIPEQIGKLKKKVNSFTKWKIIFTLYMIGMAVLLSFLLYALYNHLIK
ncbi:MAG: hypothetical protein M1365_17120 [Actinobacteria bacterium]|nr:hypothetical protein [Actinomycetota bacterium]